MKDDDVLELAARNYDISACSGNNNSFMTLLCEYDVV